MAKDELIQMSEKELVKGCIAGKEKYQNLLYQRFAGWVMNSCLRYTNSKEDAEDILQEIFIKIFLNLHQFKFDSSLWYWIKKLTINVLSVKLRKTVKKEARKLSVSIDESRAEISPVMVNEGPDIPMEVLLTMIQNLPDGYRTVFNMKEIDDYDFQAIADRLQCTNATVRSQLFKAKNTLKKNIDNWIKKEYR